MFDKATPPAYRVMHASVPLSVEAEDAFVALFGKCDTAFWLDSSLLVPGLSRWSFTRAGADRATEGLISDPSLGFVVIIEDTQAVEVVGIATVSAVHAVRAGGDYGVLQELWVAPGYRSANHGARLLQAVEAEASRRGWPMVEVSLPLSGYAELPKLTKFYERAGYGQAGMRWRRRL